MMLSRIGAVMRLEALHILRDRTTRSLLLVVPAIQLLLFGYAVNLDARNVTIAVAGDAGRTAVLSLIHETGRFSVIADGLDRGGAERLVERGEAKVGLELPPPAERLNDDAVAPTPRLIVDATDPAAVRPALAALESAFLRRVIAETRLGGVPMITTEWRYNPERRTAWSIVPGLAGAVVMISMLMLGALTLVREREQGTWEALLASPLTAADMLVGKLLPYLVIGVMQSAVIILLAHLLFALPVRGAIDILLLAAGLSAGCYLAVGFSISCITRTQMQAMQVAVFLYLPSMLLSGFLFPFEAMPHWARTIGACLPLTHFVRVSRDVLLRGGASVGLPSDMAWLTGLTLLCGVVALAFYRRRLD
jgi:ABC-2 type transport system permease protein